MSYSQPLVITYKFNAVDFSAAASTRTIQPPAGYENGRVYDAGVTDTTLVFAATTTEPEIQVGDGTTANRYAAVPIPDGLGLTEGSSSAVISGANEGKGLGGTGDETINEDDLSNGKVTVTLTQAVGGGAAGTADAYVTIAWF